MAKGRRKARGRRAATAADVDDLDAALGAGDGVKSSKQGDQKQDPQPGKKGEKKAKKRKKDDHKLLPITRKAIREVHLLKVKHSQPKQHEMAAGMDSGDDAAGEQIGQKKAVFYGLIAGMGAVCLIAALILILS